MLFFVAVFVHAVLPDLSGFPLFFRCLVFRDTNLAVPSAGTEGRAAGLEAVSSVFRRCTRQRTVAL